MHNVKYKENTFTYESLVAVVLTVDYKMLPVLVVMGGVDHGTSPHVTDLTWPIFKCTLAACIKKHVNMFPLVGKPLTTV